ncbi:MAG: hypothetical protein IID61_06955 [SAR324 cluster bacterium]|nr:hypothetical protein [SAR324 cluster bacterium]
MFDIFPTSKKIERNYIRRVLAYTLDHKEKTVHFLGVDRHTFPSTEKLYELERA